MVNATNMDRERECSVWFSSSFHMVKMLKLELYSDMWVKLGYKRRSKPPTGIVRLGFWFGLCDPDNPSLNLKSRKENRKKILTMYFIDAT